MNYKIKSRFVENKIKGKSFRSEKSRSYIETLMFLEKSITEGISGMGGNLRLFYLKSQYEKEYNEIYKELKPKEFERYIERKKKLEEKQRQEEIKWKLDEKRELEKEKKQWIALGGVK